LIGEGCCTPPDFFVFNFRSYPCNPDIWFWERLSYWHSFSLLVFKLLINKALPSRLVKWRSADTNSAPLTLEQAIAMTLSTSPELRSAAQSVAIAEGARPSRRAPKS
jgi:hypothetical protein